MLISQVIEDLQSLLSRHGDLDVIYSMDDEGNAHHRVEGLGGIMYVQDITDYYLELLDEDDVRNGLHEGEDFSKVICIN